LSLFKRRKPRPSQKQLEEAVITFLNTYPWADKRKVIEVYSEELLTGAADHVFADIRKKYKGYDKEIRVLQQHLSLLDRCRTDGIDAAFSHMLQGHKLFALVEEIAKLTKPGEMPRRIELCQEALAILGESQANEAWAHLHSELASSLAQSPLGERADNLEQALEHCQNALEVFTFETNPEDWAMIQANLANVYHDRIQGEKADNLEQAIEHCNKALKVYTRKAFPEDWASVQGKLGNAYRDRIRGLRANNIEQAIEYFRKALEVFTRQNYPQNWADTQNNMGFAYAERAIGTRADNLEKALECYQNALEVFTQEDFPEDFAKIQNNLGLVYRYRLSGERADNLEQSIECLQKALKVRTREGFPQQWALTKFNIGGTYAERIHGEREDNLEKAIEHLQQALEVYTPQSFPELWARTENSLGAAYVLRIHGERAENLEKAIGHFQQVLYSHIREILPSEWAGAQNNLAAAYTKRIKGIRADNIEEAIAHLQQALQVHTRDTYPLDWARDQGNLAKTYEQRIYGDRDDNLRQATECYRKALEVCTLEELPSLRQWILTGLGNLHFGEQNWEAGFKAYKEAIEVGGSILAGAYTEVGRKAEVGEAYLLHEHAAYCLLRLGEPSDALLRIEQGKTRLLADALAVGDADLDMLSDMQRQAMLKARQEVRELEAEMRLTPDTATQRTNAELGDLLHHARANLNRVIKSIRAEHPDFMPIGLNLPRILALIPEGGALVVPLITSQGSAVFVIPHGTKAVEAKHTLMLDRFTHADLDALSIGNDVNPGWLRVYFNMRRRETATSFERWKEYIDKFTGQLWQILMGPIHNRLIELGLEEGAPVVLIPQGGLGVLPLHAAWHQVNGVRRTFLDYYTVSYTPSSYVLEVSYRRIQDKRRYPSTLLAIVNPTNDLKYTEVESEAVAGLFTHSTRKILRGGRATQKAVVQEAAGYNYFHFSCHGFYNWQEAMHSGLILADGHPLTLSDIISSLDLSLARLVTLSACETGVTDILQSPNEYIGLPAGFLQAGAPGVISSLWTVDDQSTALLMKSFYLSHLEEGIPPAQALRLAQLWLRDATRKELGEYYESFIRMSASEALKAYGIIMTEGRPDDKPYANPFYWGAFTFTGA
jgi:CHAT domain-containing protein/tetratricopeptide (TPR) repeat protein